MLCKQFLDGCKLYGILFNPTSNVFMDAMVFTGVSPKGSMGIVSRCVLCLVGSFSFVDMVGSEGEGNQI